MAHQMGRASEALAFYKNLVFKRYFLILFARSAIGEKMLVTGPKRFGMVIDYFYLFGILVTQNNMRNACLTLSVTRQKTFSFRRGYHRGRPQPQRVLIGKIRLKELMLGTHQQNLTAPNPWEYFQRIISACNINA